MSLSWLDESKFSCLLRMDIVPIYASCSQAKSNFEILCNIDNLGFCVFSNNMQHLCFSQI